MSLSSRMATSVMEVETKFLRLFKPAALGDHKDGDRCPECGKGSVYGQKERKALVRIVGQAPQVATVYSLERLRCGACGQVFTAQEPEGMGPEKVRLEFPLDPLRYSREEHLSRSCLVWNG
jgi:hypothetical protein